MLDIGCGDGTLALLSVRDGAARRVGRDEDQRMMARTWTKLIQDGVGKPGLRAVRRRIRGGVAAKIRCSARFCKASKPAVMTAATNPSVGAVTTPGETLVTVQAMKP